MSKDADAFDSFAVYLLDEPAGEHGLEVEWAGSPEEYEDGSGIWPFRIA